MGVERLPVVGRSRRVQEEHENHERWLVSYADFITLLFAFFVVMYSMSSVNEGKFRVLADTMVASFKDPKRSLSPIQVGELVRSPYIDRVSLRTSPVVIDPNMPMVRRDVGRPQSASASASESGSGAVAEVDSPAAPDGPSTPDEALADAAPEEGAGGPEGDREGDAAPQEDGAGLAHGDTEGALAPVDEVAARVEQKLADLIAQDMVNLRRKDHSLEIEFSTNILFGSGESRLAPQAVHALTEVAEIMKDFPNPVQVEGFTDNVPIRTTEFPSNWELSAARAASVVHLFMMVGVGPERMVAIGYGEYRPVASNDTAEGRRRNRRVVLVVPADANDRQPQVRALGRGALSSASPNPPNWGG